jgi:hypothetical protein
MLRVGLVLQEEDKIMGEQAVTAYIDADAKTVTLSPGTFVVDAEEEDTVRWTVHGVPAGFTARVKFVGFAKAPEPSLTPPDVSLFKGGNILEAEGDVITGVVDLDPGKGAGQYIYQIELVGHEGGGITELQRVSSGGQTMGPAVGTRPPGPGRNP